jgi:hypothetical protein
MRVKDWPARLVAYIESRRDMPFSYETGNDCALFCAGAVEAVTGLRPDIPAYRTRAEARRIARDNGGLVAMTDAVLKRVPVDKLGRGDIGYIEAGDSGQGLCVMYPPHAITPGPNGIQLLPVSMATIGWSVDGG